MPQLIVKDGTPVSMLEAHLMSKLLFHDDELTQDACFVNEFLIQDGGLAKATTATIRRRLVRAPARITSSAQRITLHLPDRSRWETARAAIVSGTCGPPTNVTP